MESDEVKVVMLIYLDHAWEAFKVNCRAAGREPGMADLYAAVMEGAVERVQPKMMTVVAIHQTGGTGCCHGWRRFSMWR